MDKPNILPFHGHQRSPGVCDMFTKSYEAVWSLSGNNLASIYQRSPEASISGPLELPIPE